MKPSFGDSSLSGSAYVYFKDADDDGIPDDEDSCPFEDATGFDVVVKVVLIP